MKHSFTGDEVPASLFTPVSQSYYVARYNTTGFISMFLRHIYTTEECRDRYFSKDFPVDIRAEDTKPLRRGGYPLNLTYHKLRSCVSYARQGLRGRSDSIRTGRDDE